MSNSSIKAVCASQIFVHFFLLEVKLSSRLWGRQWSIWDEARCSGAEADTDAYFMLW